MTANILRAGTAPETARGPALPPDRESSGAGDGVGRILTARTAALLHSVLLHLSETGRARLAVLGGRPVVADDDDLFTALPEFTWRQNAGWRGRFLHAFDQLAEDLAEGRAPRPRTPAQEVALLVAIVQAMLLLEADWAAVERATGALPPDEEDYDWPRCHACLFRHGYVPLLLEPEFRGLEDPGNEVNRRLRIGDYRAHTWFDSFTPSGGRPLPAGM